MNNPASSIAASRREREQVIPRHRSLPRRRAATGLVQIRAALLAMILSGFLLVFLAALQTDFSPPAPLLSLRSLDTLPGSVSGPPPPPPSASTVSEPTLQPPAPDLPDLSLDMTNPNAPAVTAQLGKKPDFSLIKSNFSTEGQLGSLGSLGGTDGAGRPSMTFSAADLDSQPRLINKPSVSFPAAQKNRGVTEGQVTLEIMISSAGRVTIRRVISSTHNDFTAMATSFATRALFTPPKSDGRPVNALYRWPLIFKP